MANSAAKTIAIIILVVLLILVVVRFTPFIFAPLGVFPHVWQWAKFPKFRTIEIGPYGFFNFTSYSIISLALLIIWIFVIVWVYRDAERRGMNGVLWGLLVFIGNLVGLLIYLIVRSNNVPAPKSVQASQTCPHCQIPLSPHYIFCPTCGTRLQSVCSKCQKPVEKDWQVCPHCGEKLSS
ncbi:MAG: zinc ribbon domain-containing protein [Candidatus Aminicenantes bacterium]|nr:zinc ribbon domain-containing protein [Candidatus Aminicenantes bacterium]MDH5383516.1 zinc ribbon domain-containing protein [Candidatus Aminicenantes bacterium]MDH5742669.1 zinc ribbon domain-containing protein [Candidatus Aminicenantes bacterium]